MMIQCHYQIVLVSNSQGEINMDSVLLNTLRAETQIEKKQKIDGIFIEDIPSYVRANKDKNFILNKDFFFANKDVYISKHNRYADYPIHSHDFLEINYMLVGNCTQIVNGKKIILNTNDLLFLDIGCSHSIKKLKGNDILINILFRNKNISINWLNNLKKSKSLLYSFLLNSSYGKENKQKFIFFKNNKKTQINSIIDNLIAEYLDKKPFYNEMITSYLKILLTELVRNYDLRSEIKLTQNQKHVTTILKDIESSYATITLTSEAKKLNYNKNYLSNILKKETGKSFKELVIQQKLSNAFFLINSTSLSIQEIIENIGMSNKTFFYKKYKSVYGELPTDTRKKQTYAF